MQGIIREAEYIAWQREQKPRMCWLIERVAAYGAVPPPGEDLLAQSWRFKRKRRLWRRLQELMDPAWAREQAWERQLKRERQREEALEREALEREALERAAREIQGENQNQGENPEEDVEGQGGGEEWDEDGRDDEWDEDDRDDEATAEGEPRKPVYFGIVWLIWISFCQNVPEEFRCPEWKAGLCHLSRDWLHEPDTGDEQLQKEVWHLYECFLGPFDERYLGPPKGPPKRFPGAPE